MPRSLQEYHEVWQKNSTWWEDVDVTKESCIFFETEDTPMAEGLYALPDFGHAICFYRYFRTPEAHWYKMTIDQFRISWAATERALDGLLEEFVEQGYRTRMSERLREIVNSSLIGFIIHRIFLLPDDLDAMLSFVGNPLVDEDAYESHEEAEAHAPAFDLNNPDHCKALKERVVEFGT